MLRGGRLKYFKQIGIFITKMYKIEYNLYFFLLTVIGHLRQLLRSNLNLLQHILCHMKGLIRIHWKV